ncbi:NFAT activation molecule 1 isoform 2-T2 [Leptodactylus fuscus]|uniref:NFAT activation molecule 1 isoform X2 n=1 Tax=Leptodactylus fuscus TaxID=238119 RepID=UPI003F4E5B56
MANTALTLILILGPWLTHACTILSVTQKPLVLATLTGSDVKIVCDIMLTGGTKYKITSVLVSATNEQGRQVTTAKNTTVTHNLRAPKKASIYYCNVTCNTSNMRGSGTYIYVRDSLYVAPSSAFSKLCSGLIALFILLLLLAGSGTYLVWPFFWKKEMTTTQAQSSQQSPVVMESSRSRPVVEDAGGSLYTSLEPRTEEVYDVLEDKTKKLGSPKKHQVEVHEVAPRSPKRRPNLQAKDSSAQEKPPIKPKPKKSAPENNVYENIRG